MPSDRRETIQQCAACGAWVIGQFDGGCPECGTDE